MEDIRFAHYRVLDLSTNRILSNGGVTLAVAKIDDNLYRISGAKCHELDHYCKKNGRVKAQGRLNCRSSFRLTKPDKNTKSVRHINWVELETKPDLETLLTIAEGFYGHHLKDTEMLINSGVYLKNERH
jgi:hypothetical protein